MLRPIMAGMLIATERRGLLELFPDAVRIWWKNWQLRFLVVFSLGLQVLLIGLGKVRKHNGKLHLRFIVWSAYLLADWVATVALGVISNKLQDQSHNASSRYDLASFWAPFLLIHMGGPDTITAYSLEDNQLWQRRLLELLTQTSVTLYIFLITWPGISQLSLLSLPMLVVGLIKSIERIWSLRSASTEQFSLSLMTDPDPGPNYSKFMEEFTLKKAEGFYVKAVEVTEAPLPTASSNPIEGEESLVPKAFNLFQTFKRLFVDLILTYKDRDESRSFFQKLDDPEKAFKVIEIELGFAYDVFYTKAPVVYNKYGFILRLITLSATVATLVAFIFISRKGQYPKFDLSVTYSLLVVAIILEVLGHFILIFSDWTINWLNKQQDKSYGSFLRHLLRALSPWRGKRRSSRMAQYSILDFCQKGKRPICPWIQKLIMADDVLKKHQYTTYSNVSPTLKGLIFFYFKDISESGNKQDLTALCRSRGSRALALDKYELKSDLTWSITAVEFDQSILLWHIATELCYDLDVDTDRGKIWGCTESKQLADYMLYLLIVCPFMLPIGIGMIRFRDTCAEVQEFLQEKARGQMLNQAMASKMLLQVNTEIPPTKVKGDRSKSVLFDACRVATALRAQGKAKKWEIISGVWVEILAYAACHCRGTNHARQLRKGGELITHVWLLMAHFGITEQFQIWQGHARAKLSAK